MCCIHMFVDVKEVKTINFDKEGRKAFVFGFFKTHAKCFVNYNRSDEPQTKLHASMSEVVHQRACLEKRGSIVMDAPP